MSTPIQRAVDAAYKVFSRYTGGALSNDSLREIKKPFNEVTKSELNISQSILNNKNREGNDAPVTYIKILESKLMTVAVFILHHGGRLPLHDHPQMYGFLKVIHGKVSIKTYTPIDPFHGKIPETVIDSLKAKYGKAYPVFPAKYEGTTDVSEMDQECCVLSPAERNIHEITATSESAAFIDLLAPPYNQESLVDYRPCSYFKEICADQADPNIRYLIRINPPGDYWCDQAEYTGPSVSNLS